MLGLFGGGAAVATVIIVLALVLPGWLAALITTAGLLALGGIAGLLGQSRMRAAG